MPYKSDAQRRFAFGTHQPWADKWADETPKGKDLPEHVEKKALSRLAKKKKGRKGRSCKE